MATWYGTESIMDIDDDPAIIESVASTVSNSRSAFGNDLDFYKTIPVCAVRRHDSSILGNICSNNV
jgi:hypothetical protein